MNPLENAESISDIVKLVARSEIAELKARYFRLLDTKQWDAWSMSFAPDATMDMTGEPEAMRSAGLTVPDIDPQNLAWKGRENIRAAVSNATASLSTCHHGHVHEFTLISPTQAKAIWAMEDVVCFTASQGFRGYGHYHDSYVKVDGRWFIESTKLSRLFVLPFGQN